MASFNKVLLLGNLTRDPAVKFLPSGTKVAEFGLATNRVWNDPKTGEKRETPTFVDCQVMGRMADVIERYCRKGSPLFLEGRLEYRAWEAKDGTKRSKLDVFVENFQLLGGRREDSGGEGGAGPGRAAEARSGVEEAAGAGADGAPPLDDVPF
jgi:single-strand DNA-binding protein